MSATETQGVRLHYELSGTEDGSVLVFANSLGSSLRMWDKVRVAVERRYRVLRYDYRGHGKSSAPPRPYTIEQLGDDLLALLDHLEIDRVHLCGLSLGGLVATWMGIHAPRRVDRIIAANTSARIGTRQGWEQRMAMVKRLGMDGLASLTLERWFTTSYRERHPEEMESVRQMISATSVEGYVGCCEVLRDTDLRGDTAAIEAPCLVISGTHDPATPPVDGLALHSALRHSSYVELDASHLSAWEQPEGFAEAVLRFLAEKEPTNE